MRTITLHRKAGWYGRIRKLKLFVDGVDVGIIKAGETITLPIPDSAQEIYGKMDWGKTKPFSLSTLSNDDTVNIIAWFPLNPLLSMGFPLIPIRFEFSR